MKFYTLLLALIISVSSLEVFAQEGGNNVAMTAYEYYGKKINDKDAMNPSQFLSAIESKDSMDVKLEAKILMCCKKKGCWMDLDLENGQTMKVRFKDYEFFVPKDADGRTAVVQGQAKLETIDVATLKHYAEDAGKSEAEIAAITKPKKAYSFTAEGVIIK